eukprot:g2138.t1
MDEAQAEEENPDGPDALGNLLQHFRGELQAGGVVRADAALSKAELDAQMTELGNRLDTRQKMNGCLFRRVQMLEEVLQLERQKRGALLADMSGFLTPRTAKDEVPQLQDSEEASGWRSSMYCN